MLDIRHIKVNHSHQSSILNLLDFFRAYQFLKPILFYGPAILCIWSSYLVCHIKVNNGRQLAIFNLIDEIVQDASYTCAKFRYFTQPSIGIMQAITQKRPFYISTILWKN